MTGDFRAARLALRVAALGLVFATPVAADAPTSGVDRQYEPFRSGDPAIVDRFTQLEWDRPVTYDARTAFDEAAASCASEGRRLPSLKELLTIVDEEPHAEYDSGRLELVARYIDRQAFPKTPAEEFWTSSSKDETTVFTVDFATGKTQTANAAQDKRRVRCVKAR